MSKRVRLFTYKPNGRRNAKHKVKELRQGINELKNPVLIVAKGLSYKYDDVTHNSGTAVYVSPRGTTKKMYFGCGDRFTLYDTVGERDNMHEVWLGDHKAMLETSKKHFNDGRVNGSGVKSTGTHDTQLNSRVKRRIAYKVKMAELAKKG